MARLPQPGGDQGNWGDVLNDYLLTSHDATGFILGNTVTEAQLAPAVRAKLNTVGGAVGPQGPIGASGATGSQGLQGVPGDDGVQGVQGIPGVAGPANTLTIGTVISGLTADATIVGTAPNQTLNLTLVKGDQGIQGLPGADGGQGIQGIQGLPGTPGVAGSDGSDGVDGAPGTTSWTGITDRPVIPAIVASLTPPVSPAFGDMWVDLSA